MTTLLRDGGYLERPRISPEDHIVFDESRQLGMADGASLQAGSHGRSHHVPIGRRHLALVDAGNRSQEPASPRTDVRRGSSLHTAVMTSTAAGWPFPYVASTPCAEAKGKWRASTHTQLLECPSGCLRTGHERPPDNHARPQRSKVSTLLWRGRKWCRPAAAGHSPSSVLRPGARARECGTRFRRGKRDSR